MRFGATAFFDGTTPTFAGGAAPGGPSLASSDAYDAVAGEFRAGLLLNAARAGAQAVTLADGTVLLFGGAAPGAVGIESIAGGKATPQATGFPPDQVEHAAVAFPDGTVLIKTFLVRQGGTVVDPLTGLLRARARHTATLLGGAAGAAAVIAGGRDAVGPVDVIELYTPSGGFEPSGALLTPRFDHSATLLASGLVLVVGGTGADGQPVARAELIDPLQRSAHLAGVLRTPRAQHTATLLPSGRVLITGGLGGDGAPTASVEIFDPTLGAAGDFVAAQPLSSPRSGHAALPLCDGTLLLSGGGPGADLYTPAP